MCGMQIMEQALDELAGWAYNYKKLRPSLDLVMQPHIVAGFLAFKKARDNVPSTLLRTSTQLSLVVPFVLSGDCPQAKSYLPSQVDQLMKWYTSLKASFRGQVQQDNLVIPSTPKSSVTLAEQWQHNQAEWEATLHAYKVSLHILPGKRVVPCRAATHSSSLHMAWPYAGQQFNHDRQAC